MTCRIRLTLAAAAFVSLLSCRGDSVSPDVDGPMFAVSDGAHNGNNAFFFLPPLFKMPTVHPGTFNADLRPSVEICDLGIRPTTVPPPPRTCGANVAVFAPGSVVVSTTDESYQVNWHTDQSNLLLNHDYRIRVLVGGAELGFADVDPVSNGSQLKNVQTNEYIGLVDGRTLPIKFRIEDGALCGVTTTPCSAGTIDLETGGNVELVVTENGVIQEVFEVSVETGTTATFGGQPVSDVTFNVEECVDGGIDLDLRPFGRCVQVTTFFTETGGEGGQELALANAESEFPLVISTCRLEASGELEGLSEEAEGYITLHQQDGVTVRALSHVHPHCDVITRLNAAPQGLVRRGLHQLGDLAARLFLPQTLHAGARSAVINLGAGGGTRVLGTDCTTTTTPTARMLLAECSTTPSASAPLGVGPAFVGAARTVSKFQFFQPAIMIRDETTNNLTAATSSPVSKPPAVLVVDAEQTAVPVAGASITFEVTAGGGNFGMNGSTPITHIEVTTDASGIATVPTWVLGPEAGPNTVRASGKGLAAKPLDLKPFVPDIQGVNETVELPTPTDAHSVTFTATAGGGPDLVIESLSHAPAELSDGELIEYSAVVKNIGTAPVTRPAIRIDLVQEEGTSPWPGESTTLIAGGILGPGESVTLTRNRSLQLPAGIYRATATVDPDNRVPETNEENNGGTLQLFVSEGVPAINGVLGFAEWAGAQSYGPYTVNLPDGGTTTATIFMRSEPFACCTTMFVGVKFGMDLSSYELVTFGVRLDENADGTWNAGADALGEDGFVAQQRVRGARLDRFFDEFFNSDVGQGQRDDLFGGTNDGVSASTDGLAPTVLEMSHETNNSDKLDAVLTTDSSVPFALIITIGPSSNPAITLIPFEGPLPLFFVR